MTEEEGRERLVRRFRRVKALVTTLVVLGLFIQGMGQQVAQAAGWFRASSYVAAWLAGAMFQVVACALYLRLKGRSAWYSLVGILGLFGVLAVIFMDKKCLRCGRREARRATACENCGAPL